MSNPPSDIHPDLDALFDRYRAAPDSHVFAPLADACRKHGMIDEAIDIVERGVAKHPNYASGHVVRGKCYFDRGDMDAAGEAFRKVLRIDANNLVALKYLGALCADAGDAAGAREHFKHILALDPENREIRSRLESLEDEAPRAGVSIEADSRDDDDAMRDDDGFEGAPITLGDDDTSASDDLATMTLADIYRSQGYTDKALRIYREVLRRQPDNVEVIARIRAMESEGSGASTPAGAGAAQEPPALDADSGVLFEEVGRGAATVAKSDAGGAGPAPGGAPADDARAGSETGSSALEGRPIEEARSYEQFKRWLKNLAD